MERNKGRLTWLLSPAFSLFSEMINVGKLNGEFLGRLLVQFLNRPNNKQIRLEYVAKLSYKGILNKGNTWP